MPRSTPTRLPLSPPAHRRERLHCRLRHNPVAALLRSPEARFRLRRKPSARLYRRHVRHRDGSLAPDNFGWM
ncbi:MAG: hypothetical protein ACREE4_05595 [Stellaceae bacterium]